MIIDDQMHLSWAIGQSRKKRKSISAELTLRYSNVGNTDRGLNTFYIFLYKLK